MCGCVGFRFGCSLSWRVAVLAAHTTDVSVSDSRSLCPALVLLSSPWPQHGSRAWGGSLRCQYVWEPLCSRWFVGMSDVLMCCVMGVAMHAVRPACRITACGVLSLVPRAPGMAASCFQNIQPCSVNACISVRAVPRSCRVTWLNRASHINGCLIRVGSSCFVSCRLMLGQEYATSALLRPQALSVDAADVCACGPACPSSRQSRGRPGRLPPGPPLQLRSRRMLLLLLPHRQPRRRPHPALQRWWWTRRT
jgi:hypothetical protein